MKSQTNSKFKLSFGSGIIRVLLTLTFAFWFYMIWSSPQELNAKLDVVQIKYSALHKVQVEYKSEVQEWKNLLLRSKTKETLENNWQKYELQYQKVLKDALQITQDNEIRDVKNNMNLFIEAHQNNHELYKKSLDVFVNSNFDSHLADKEVAGIDRPLENILEDADKAMQDEKKSINESLTAKTRSQIEKSLMILGFIALITIWMPKW
jgi:methyl-accepting chemotaxis protein